MAFVAIATGAAAVIGAGASIIGGNNAARSQRDAAATNAQLQREQDAEARRQFDLNRADLTPFREAGYTALNQLTKGTVDGGEFNRNFTLGDFNRDPGAEFRRSEGQRGLESSASARGGILSGGALKAISRYNSDVASQEYGAAYNRFNNDLTTRFNRLSSLAGTGQTATNTGIADGNNFIGNRQTGVNNIASNNNAAANATASSYVNTANAIGGAANNVGSFFALRDLYKTPRAYNDPFGLSSLKKGV